MSRRRAVDWASYVLYVSRSEVALFHIFPLTWLCPLTWLDTPVRLRPKAALEAVYGASELQAMWSSACDAWSAIFAAGGDVCSDEARSVCCPVLLLHGAKDPITPMDQAQWFALHVPGVMRAVEEGEGGSEGGVHVFPEGKHNIHQRFAAEFNAKVLRFLAK